MSFPGKRAARLLGVAGTLVGCNLPLVRADSGASVNGVSGNGVITDVTAPLPGGRRSLKVFHIDLDQAPEHRFDEVTTHFNTTIWRFYDKLIAGKEVDQEPTLSMGVREVLAGFGTECL